MREFRQTEKQLKIMEAILEIHDAGRVISLAELKEKLDHGPKVSAQAVRCSLKYLSDHGFLTSERPGLFRFYKPTAKAYSHFRRSV